MQTNNLNLALVAAVGMVLILAGSAEAQTGQTIGIRGEAPSEWALKNRGQLSRGEDLDLLRRAGPAGDIQTWVADGDLTPVQSGDDGPKSIHAELLLEIDADGAVTECKVKAASHPSAVETLCERLSPRVRMIPALDRTGVRVADFYDVEVWAQGEAGFPLPPPRLQVRAPTVSDWPYQTVSLTVVTGGFDHLVAHPFSSGAYNGPVARIVITPDDQGRPQCTLAPYFIEDATLNAEACPTALRGRYDFSGENQGEAAYLFFFRQEGRLALLLPAYNREQTGQPRAEPMAEVRAGLTTDAVERLRLDFWVDLDGGIGGCRIHTSSGDDVQDIAACDRLQRLGRFDRSLDIFGRALPRTMIGWAIPPA